MMSSTPLDLPTLISQSPYVAKLAHVEKARPEVERHLFGPLINEHIKKAQEKVQQVNKKNKLNKANRDNSNKQQQELSENRSTQQEEDEKTETKSSNQSPWAGNIVNVKI